MKYAGKVLIILLVMFIIFAVIPIQSEAEQSEAGYQEFESRVLSEGDEGSDVALLQKKLHDLSFYEDDIDGIYGPATKEAVKDFQFSNDLTVDGIVGPGTYGELPGDELLSRISFSRNDIILLARVIHGEARGEIYKGMVAVGAVVLNRVESDEFPDNIRDVAVQSGQFSCLLDGQANLYPGQRSIDAARAALMGYDPTYGSLYFYNPEVATNVEWISRRPVVKRIGNHVFAH